MGIVSTYIVPHPPLIIPDIGRGQERGIADTIESFNKIARKISEIKPDTIIVLTSHSIMYDDYIHISPGKKQVVTLEILVIKVYLLKQDMTKN